MADLLLTVLVAAGALPYTLFTLTYGWFARSVWPREVTGWALVIGAASSALLLDLTLLFYVVTPSPLVGLIVTAVVVGLIALAGWLKLGALVIEMRNGRRHVPPQP